MNTLQTTLTALQSQLESQKEASKYYYDNVFSKEVATLEAEVIRPFESTTITTAFVEPPYVPAETPELPSVNGMFAFAVPSTETVPFASPGTHT